MEHLTHRKEPLFHNVKDIVCWPQVTHPILDEERICFSRPKHEKEVNIKHKISNKHAVNSMIYTIKSLILVGVLTGGNGISHPLHLWWSARAYPRAPKSESGFQIILLQPRLIFSRDPSEPSTISPKVGPLLVPRILGLWALDQIMISPAFNRTKTEDTIDPSGVLGASFLTWFWLAGSLRATMLLPFMGYSQFNHYMIITWTPFISNLFFSTTILVSSTALGV